MRDYKSAYDTVRVNETDLGQKAIEMLQKAAMTSDPDLKQKALFAMGYRELYSNSFWQESVWDDQTCAYVKKYNRQSAQFRAFQALFVMVEAAADEPAYISKCDEFRKFRNYYLRNR